MLFNSFEFLLFFPLVFIIYWLLHNDLKKQNLLLLLSSYFFYACWDWRFLSLIIFSSFVDYSIGLKIYNTEAKDKRKRWLWLSIGTNLGLLAVFKYYNFFAESFAHFMQTLGWQPNDLTLTIILPVGISFYTFQTLSYTIDIYRKDFKPTQNIISFFTYIAFFPQLVAGPIERAVNLLPQIEKKRSIDKELFNEGLVQFFIGLFRKIVIADTLSAYVDAVYINVGFHDSTTLLLATFLFAFQIYFDFSGYSDMAIGSAKLLGFKFGQNFNLPYFSKSITTFWRKWHISLSTWLRDYLYISLGGNQKGKLLTYRNLMLTMLLGGLWHGSSWKFIVWGGIHGAALCLERILRNRSFWRPLQRFHLLGYLSTFSIVLLSWVFFRANDFDDAMFTVKKIFQFNFSAPFIPDRSLLTNTAICLFLGILFDFYLFRKKIDLEHLGKKMNLTQIVILLSILILLINLFYSTALNFIYFQF